MSSNNTNTNVYNSQNDPTGIKHAYELQKRTEEEHSKMYGQLLNDMKDETSNSNIKNIQVTKKENGKIITSQRTVKEGDKISTAYSKKSNEVIVAPTRLRVTGFKNSYVSSSLIDSDTILYSASTKSYKDLPLPVTGKDKNPNKLV